MACGASSETSVPIDPSLHLDTTVEKPAQTEEELSASTKNNGDPIAIDQSSVSAAAVISNDDLPPGLGSIAVNKELTPVAQVAPSETSEATTIVPEANNLFDSDATLVKDETTKNTPSELTNSPSGIKRKIEEVDEDAEGEDDNEDDDGESSEDDRLAIVRNPDGSVFQADDVK